jgi:hypothetical protein
MAVGMRNRPRFVCQNLECGCEIEVTKAPRSGAESSPWCACGAEMKKPYVKPSVTTRPLAKAKTSHA